MFVFLNNRKQNSCAASRFYYSMKKVTRVPFLHLNLFFFLAHDSLWRYWVSVMAYAYLTSMHICTTAGMMTNWIAEISKYRNMHTWLSLSKTADGVWPHTIALIWMGLAQATSLGSFQPSHLMAQFPLGAVLQSQHLPKSARCSNTQVLWW